MAVYVRTPQGQAAALNANSALPRKLRTLLISIDGKTRTETYVKSLSAFGDVESLLASLVNAGLIEVSGSDPARARGRPDPVQAAPPPALHDALADWERTLVMRAPTGFAASGHTEGAQPAFAPTHSFAADSGSAPAFGARKYAPAHADGKVSLAGNTAHYQLKSAIGLISDFVSMHMPIESIEIVLELERLSSVEQLLASLKGYESMIAGIGEPARQHIAALRSTLSSYG